MKAQDCWQSATRSGGSLLVQIKVSLIASIRILRARWTAAEQEQATRLVRAVNGVLRESRRLQELMCRILVEVVHMPASPPVLEYRAVGVNAAGRAVSSHFSSLSYSNLKHLKLTSMLHTMSNRLLSLFPSLPPPNFRLNSRAHHPDHSSDATDSHLSARGSLEIRHE